MAKQVINVGSVANDKTGDALRTAFNKVNSNFNELYGGSAIGATGPQGPAGANGATGPSAIVNTGDITFQGTTIIGATGTEGYEYGLVQILPNTDWPGQAVNIYPTIAGVDQLHIHMSASDPSADLFLGDDSSYVSAKNDGSIEVASFQDVQNSISNIAWLDRGGRLNINYGWDANGVWFSGDADLNFNSGNYPIFFANSFTSTDKIDISFKFEFNQNCADVSVAIWSNSQIPQFSWDSNASRIACQYDCNGIALITGQQAGADTSISLVQGNTYKAQLIYDPNDAPNITFNTYDDQDNLLYTVTLDETLLANENYTFGFTADQDNLTLRTYIHDLTVLVNDSPYYSNTLQSGNSGKQNKFDFDIQGNFRLPPGGEVKDHEDTSYRDIPRSAVVSQQEYYLSLADKGKFVYGEDAWIVVPTDAEVNFPIGTTITLITQEESEYNFGYYVNSYNEGDVTIIVPGLPIVTTGYDVPLASIATLIKVDVNKWFLSGAGVTLD